MSPMINDDGSETLPGSLPDYMVTNLTAQEFFSMAPEELFLKTGLVESKNEARRLMKQGGLRFDGKVVDPGWSKMSTWIINEWYIMLQRGKKKKHFIHLDGDSAEVIPLKGGYP